MLGLTLLTLLASFPLCPPPTLAASAGSAAEAPIKARHKKPQAAAAAAKPVLIAPEGSIRIPVENIDGALLVRATLSRTAESDTTGSLVLDTGAGYLALDPRLIDRLGLADVAVPPMTFAARPLRRLRIGEFSQDVVGPVLGVETSVIEQATDRSVMGLLGYEPLSSFAIRIDYRIDTLALIPVRRDGIAATSARRGGAASMAAGQAAFFMARNASREVLGAALGADAACLPFQLEGDGKILVKAKLGGNGDRGGEALTLVLDTGATKSVLFRRSFERARGDRVWREMHGLSAPTLYGTEDAYMARVPRTELAGEGTTIATNDIDFAVMQSDLEEALSQAVHQPVDGLLGYSFLRRFRVTIDYPHRVVWLEPLAVPLDQRRYEYSHVGVQIERRAGVLRVVAIATGSPAAAAGITPDAEIVAIDGVSTASMDVVAASRRLEGAPGTRVSLQLRQGTALRSYRLTRRELL